MLPKNCLVFLFVICTYAAEISAQQEIYRVISTNGLTLRDIPSKNGKSLAVAPLGAKVTVLSSPEKEWEGHIYQRNSRYTGASKIDTIGLAMDTEVTDFNFVKKKVAVPHIGFWWRVKYLGKEGYMFSGFLSPLENDPGYFEISEGYRLRMPGPFASPVAEPGWQWYGLFRSDDGSMSLKKVSTRYLAVDYRLLSDSLRRAAGFFEERYADRVDVIETSPAGSLILIGSRRAMKEMPRVTGEHASFDEKGNSFILQRPPTPYQAGTISKSALQYDVHGSAINWYFTGHNNLRQPVELVVPAHRESGKEIPAKTYKPIALEWYGDLDGDKRLDYIVAMASETDGYATVLFLSSEAGSGEVVKAVAAIHEYDI